MIGDLTKQFIDRRARDIRGRLLQVLADAEEFHGWLAAQNAAGKLTGPNGPYENAADDLTNIVGMADQYTELGQVKAGQVAVPEAKDFDAYGANVPPLWPTPSGVSY